MDLREAAQQALKDLEYFAECGWESDAIVPLRAALADPTCQESRHVEPVGYFSINSYGNWEQNESGYGTPLYEAPPTSQESRQVEPVAYCTLEQLAHLKLAVPSEDKIAIYTAQPKRKPLTDEEMGVALGMVEPVAWAVITKGRKLYKAASTKESAERKAAQQIDKLGVEWECSVVPLYLAAPKREPLTDKEIADLFNGQIFHLTDVHSVIDFVRDIERAHGIGGEN